MPPVEHRDGEQVEDRQVDRQERHEGDQRHHTPAGELPRHLSDQHGAADLPGGNVAEHDPLEGEQHQLHVGPGAVPPFDHGSHRAVLRAQRLHVGDDPDPHYLDRLAGQRIRLGLLRRQQWSYEHRVVTQQGELQGVTGVPLHGSPDVVEGAHRVAVHRQDLVAPLESGLSG